MGSHSGSQSARRAPLPLPLWQDIPQIRATTTQPSTRGTPKRCPAVYQVVFIPHIANSLRSLSSFILFLPIYLLAVALPMPCHRTILTLAMVYPTHVQIPPLFSDFLVSAARARGAASARKQRAVFTLHSNRNTNLPVPISSIYSSA